MVSVLEVPALRRQALPMSVETYHALGEMGFLDEANELLEGFVFPKMPKSPRHRIISQRLLMLLRAVLPSNLSLWQEQPITTFGSEPEPDIAVVEGTDEDYARRHPTTALLTMEVAISSLERDEVKAGIYARAGIAEYWLVNAGDNEVVIYTQPTADGYLETKILRQGETAISSVLGQFKVDLNEMLK